MGRKLYKPEEIVGRLRQAEVFPAGQPGEVSQFGVGTCPRITVIPCKNGDPSAFYETLSCSGRGELHIFHKSFTINDLGSTQE